jgi:surface protein
LFYSESPVFKNSTYNADWASLRCPALTGGIGNDFYQATWDYVQDTRSGMAKWGSMSTWDTSTITTMDRAFSIARDVSGTNTATIPGNLKVELFNYPGVLLWDTSKVKSMFSFLFGAKAFNGDLSAFDTSGVTNMGSMFYSANNYNGDMSTWNTGEVVVMSSVFHSAHAFQGKGVDSWNTAKVGNMFAMFYNANVFNADLGTWKTAQVSTIRQMFSLTTAFTGNGLSKFDITKICTSCQDARPGFENTFESAAGLTACSKRNMLDEWNTSTSHNETTREAVVVVPP